MATGVRRGPTKLDEREMMAWRGLLRVHSSLVKTLDSELEHAHGIALTSYEVISRLGRAEGGRLRMCELAQLVLLSRSGLTRLVDRLERDGLVVRGSCEDDARGAFAVLTAAGRELLDQARPTHLAGVRRHFLEHFSAEELDSLGALWQRVVDSPFA
jgi:DNA-binding MarR family transcriptional regulator